MNTKAHPAGSAKIDPAQLGFDFDGVIADTAESFLRLAREQYGLCSFRREDITAFNVEECLGIEREQASALFRRILHDSVAAGLQPMPGAVEVLSELAELGTITVITARPSAGPTEDWLAAFLHPAVHSSIRLIAMGNHDDKARHILAQGLRYFIDDRAETCMQLNAAGIQPIVFSQPWNHACRQFPAVRSWQEIRALCL